MECSIHVHIAISTCIYYYWWLSLQYAPRISFIILGMTVGFTQVTNTAIESAEYVEVCVDVLIPGEALRNFTVILIPEEGN